MPHLAIPPISLVLGLTKMNSDGAWINKEVAARGGVIRRTDGTWLVGFSCKYNVISPLAAELYAINEPYGWYVLNCDGAAKGCPGPAGGGAIIRDYAGSFVTAFASSFGYCSAFRAEIMALTRGLELAKNCQISKLEIQMDNIACIQAMNKQEVPRGENIHDIIYCKELIANTPWEVKLAHVYREGNRAADWLANRGVIQDSQLVYFSNSIPVELSRILEEDVQGVALPRLIPP